MHSQHLLKAVSHFGAFFSLSLLLPKIRSEVKRPGRHARRGASAVGRVPGLGADFSPPVFLSCRWTEAAQTDQFQRKTVTHA